MKKNLLLLTFTFFSALFNTVLGQSNAGCSNCRTTPVCSAEKNSVIFEFLGASEQANGNTMIRFNIANLSQFPFEHVTFELPGKNIAAASPTSSYIGRYHYVVQNPYADSLLKFTGLNTATYRYDQQDVFRFEVNSALLKAPGNSKLQIVVKAGDVTSSIVFDIENCAKKTITPLPVELISFNGTSTEQGVALTWLTAAEKNCAYFTVQHSLDGSKFEAIGKVAGHGTTAAKQTYQFNHTQPVPGNNYYRLKQVDIDDKFSYSPIILVSTNPKSKVPADFSVYPNPVTENKFFIRLGNEISAAETVQILLYDLNGKAILKQDSKGEQEITLALENKMVLPGIYVVKVVQGTNQQVRKVIIQ